MASTGKASRIGPELVSATDPKPKTKSIKSLPFDRVSFPKQLEILRAYAAASAQGTKPALLPEVAAIVEMAQETVSPCNGFFTSVGFVQKTDRAFLVSSEVLAFFRAYDWNKETASHKLGPLLQASWFGQALLPRLSFKPIDEDEAIEVLAGETAAGPSSRKNLRLLIDYLEAGGLLNRDGGMLKIRPSTGVTEPTAQNQDAVMTKEAISENQSIRPKVATAFSQMAQGALRFNVSFDVDMTEMANWRADRIAAFFNGVAQVLAAKAEVEKAAGQ